MNEKSEINNNKNVDSRWPERDKNTGQKFQYTKKELVINIQKENSLKILP